MSRKIKIFVLVVFILILLGLAHYQLRNTSPLYNYFFSPKDLYKTLAESDFDLSNSGLEKELNFTAKYPGNHWVAILVEHPPEAMEKYQSDFKVKIEMIGENKVLSESFANDSNYWFYGGPGRSGFSLVRYNLPKDLPIGERLRLKAKVEKASPTFNQKYGKQRLIVSKYSDE